MHLGRIRVSEPKGKEKDPLSLSLFAYAARRSARQTNRSRSTLSVSSQDGSRCTCLRMSSSNCGNDQTDKECRPAAVKPPWNEDNRPLVIDMTDRPIPASRHRLRFRCRWQLAIRASPLQMNLSSSTEGAQWAYQYVF